MEQCNSETTAFLDCYDNNTEVALACANCFLEGLVTEGSDSLSCGILQAKTVDTNYASCTDVCITNCDGDFIKLKHCGVPLFCNVEVALAIA